jgi:hypothetical protein
MKSIFFILFNVILTFNCLEAQNLYIRLDLSTGKQSKYVNAPYYSKEDKVQRVENAYYMDYYIYQGYPLYFNSKNRSKAITISLTQLSQYDVKTCQTLETLLKPKSRDEQMQYFHSFQKIFIVEINNRNQQATLTEVELDVDIE